ncbi:hypothetical protein LguiB_017817 [Lonicera macranthoides]
MSTSHNQDPQNQDQEEEEIGKLAVRLANAVVLPMVLKSALELNLIGIISAAGDGAWLSPSEIAARVPTCNPQAAVLLGRMLRLLASYEVVKCSVRTGEEGDVERVYGVGPICKFMRNDGGDEGGSVGPLFLLHHDKIFMESWCHLNEVILEGGIPFNRAYGMTAFEYPRTDQRFNRVFNRAMSNHTTLIIKRILEIYKGFEGLNVLVDVGGGIGVTLSIITSKYPHLKAINFDLPHVLADAPSYSGFEGLNVLVDVGGGIGVTLSIITSKYPHLKAINFDLPHVLADAPFYSGVEHVGGDMFVSVPKGDAIFMKWILHDWSDEHCLKLLANCNEALPDSGKVIIVESILPDVPESSVSSQIVFEQDLIMLAQNPGGKERTQKDYNALAVKSGFSGCEVICCAYNSWVMEFKK